MTHDGPPSDAVEMDRDQLFSAKMRELDAQAEQIARQGGDTSALEGEMNTLRAEYDSETAAQASSGETVTAETGIPEFTEVTPVAPAEIAVEVPLTEEEQRINASRADYAQKLADDIEVAGIEDGAWTVDNSIRSDANREYVSRARQAAIAERNSEATIPVTSETATQPTAVLAEKSESAEQAQVDEYEAFKASFNERTSAFAERAKEMLIRTAFGIKKGVEGIGAGGNAVFEAGASTMNAVGERAVGIGDRAAEAYQGAKDAVVETAQAGRDAVVGGVRAVGRGIETGAAVTLGAGILAAEAVGRGVQSTLELGERGINAGRNFVESGIEKARQAKENAVKKMSDARAAAAAAVNSVAHAAESKTVETVNSGKEAIHNGVSAVVEAGTALKNRATEGIRSAWESMKNKKNMIKRGLIMAKVGYHESQGNRISAEAQEKFTKANKARAALAALES